MVLWINAVGYIRGTRFVGNKHNDEDNHIAFATAGGQGAVNLAGNYWDPDIRTTGFVVAPTQPCPHATCRVPLELGMVGNGAGTVTFALDDPGYAAILEMLAEEEYNGLATVEEHFETFVDGPPYSCASADDACLWEIPAGMKLEFTATP